MDESKFPTMRFINCGKCGTMFVASLSGIDECPECHAVETGAGSDAGAAGANPADGG